MMCGIPLKESKKWEKAFEIMVALILRCKYKGQEAKGKGQGAKGKR